MYTFHVNKDGSTQMICTMDDGHLINTVKYYCKKIRMCTEAMQIEDSLDFKVMAAFNPNYSVTRQKGEAVNRLVMFSNKLGNYLMEIVLRGLSEEVKTDIQMAYGRASGLHYSLKQLPSLNDHDDDDSFDDYNEPDGHAYENTLPRQC